jgi:hypothetical protein
MILFTRSIAQTFRALLQRCSVGRSRGHPPPLIVRVRGGASTIASTTTEGVLLTHTWPADPKQTELLVVPGKVLADVEGDTDDPVSLDQKSKLRGTVRWAGGGKPRSLPVELILPGRQHELPEPPEFVPVTPTLLTALHECGKTAARDSGRYAVSKVQVQGKAGRVAGTDGKVALLWSGFKFPFLGDVLVPAVPVFGAKPLARISDVRIGLTAAHLVVAMGSWAVWLPTDTTARFPDIAGVIPRHVPTTVTIDDADATDLLPVLPGLPGKEDEHRPVTLDADRSVRVRGRSGNLVDEWLLGRSNHAGPPILVPIDRRVFARALSLGCRTWRLNPERPVVAEGEGVTLLWSAIE